MNSKLGIKIHQLRVQAGDSQETLAQKLHVTRQTISKWENGMSEPSFESINMLATLYHVNLSYFQNDHPQQSNKKDNMKSLFFPDTLLYKWMIVMVTYFSVLFLGPISLFLSIPYLVSNLRKKNFLFSIVFAIAFLYGVNILVTILFPGLAPHRLEIKPN